MLTLRSAKAQSNNTNKSICNFWIGSALPEYRKFNVQIVNFGIWTSTGAITIQNEAGNTAQFIEIHIKNLYQPNNFDVLTNGSSTVLGFIQAFKSNSSALFLNEQQPVKTIVKPSSNDLEIELHAFNDGLIQPSSGGTIEWFLELQFSPVDE